MGCLNAKLADDDFDDGCPEPQRVFSAKASSADGGCGADDDYEGCGGGGGESLSAAAAADEDGGPGDGRSPAAASAAAAGGSAAAGAAKPWCRFRFDPRVTAKYDVKALIGKGSFSRVVRVENRVTRQPYAIKMIDRARGRDLFEAELSVLRRVRHRYVIQLVEVYESRERAYMVMELATGGDLFDRVVARGCFCEREAAGVLRMVLSGLGYLHALGITHRDLKPENLLYYHPGYDSRILITDFGLSATRRSADEPMRTTCGTPEYIAPEILARQPYCSKVDVWSTGVIAYILLSGAMPFDDENRTRLYRQILRAKYSYPPEQWSNVGSEAKAFIDRLLTLDVAQRPTAVEALQDPWLLLAHHSGTGSSAARNRHAGSNSLSRRQSTRASSSCNTTACGGGAARSSRSSRSDQSQRSNRSLRSDRRRVQPEELDELHRDPDVAAELGRVRGSGSFYSQAAST